MTDVLQVPPSVLATAPAATPRLARANPSAIQGPAEWEAIRADAFAVIDGAPSRIAEITEKFDAEEARSLCEMVRSQVAHATREMRQMQQDLAA